MIKINVLPLLRFFPGACIIAALPLLLAGCQPEPAATPPIAAEPAAEAPKKPRPKIARSKPIAPKAMPAAFAAEVPAAVESEAPPPPPLPQPVPPAPARVAPEAFIAELALAQASLLGGDDKAASEHLAQLDDYTAQEGLPPQQRYAVIVEYRLKSEKGLQRAVLPAPDDDGNGLRPLFDVMSQFGKKVTLHDIKLAAVTVAPGETLHLKESGAELIQQKTSEQQQRLLANSEPLPALEGAQIYLQLIPQFIEHRYRDAGYLSVDNVKRLLAEASRSQPEEEKAIKAMSQNLEALEARLHSELPYRI